MLRRLLILLSLLATQLQAGEVTVATASNALDAVEEVAEAFTEATGHQVNLAHGATGALFAQIVAGAPIDVFLAADTLRPARLKGEGRAVETKTVLLGRLVLVSRVEVGLAGLAEEIEGKTVALADPLVAPYGLASVVAMERLELDTARFRPVLAANVGQAAALFTTGNADFAFVAASQAKALGAPFILSLDTVAPQIRQDAALLSETDAARSFWDWLSTDATAVIFRRHGFGLPR